jgi:hypothetical protein
MFEARLEQGGLIKKVIEAIKDLVTDANLECSPEALTLQARAAHALVRTPSERARALAAIAAARQPRAHPLVLAATPWPPSPAAHRALAAAPPPLRAQAMDSSHVSLVALKLKATGFTE